LTISDESLRRLHRCGRPPVKLRMKDDIENLAYETGGTPENVKAASNLTEDLSTARSTPPG